MTILRLSYFRMSKKMNCYWHNFIHFFSLSPAIESEKMQNVSLSEYSSNDKILMVWSYSDCIRSTRWFQLVLSRKKDVVFRISSHRSRDVTERELD